MNEEETIKYIENVINTIKESDMLFDEPANISCGVRMAGALKGILNLYNQEKEKNKKLEEDKRVFEILEKEHKKEIDVREQKEIMQSKVIDMMAEDLLDGSMRSSFWIIKGIKDKQQVKEYYFKKARGEEDVKEN